MANQDTDVDVVVRAIAEGLSDVNALADSVDKLGGDSDQAGQKAERLSNDLQQLTNQSSLITQFESASSRVDRLSASMSSLQAELDQYQAAQQRFQGNAETVSSALELQREATASLGSELQSLGVQLELAKTAQQDATAAARAAGSGDAEAAAAAQAAKQQVADLTAQLKAKNTEYTEAVRTEKQLQQAFDSDTQSAAEAQTSINRLTGTISEQQAVLDQAQARQTELAASLAEYKISTDDLGGAQQRLTERLTETQAATVSLNNSLREQVAALTPIQQAFDTLGVKSVASLEAARDQARAAFETLQSSGTVAAADLDRAWAAVAAAELEVAEAAGEMETKTVLAALEAEAATEAQREAVAALKAQYLDAGDGAEKATELFKLAGEAALAFFGIQLGAEMVKGLADLADEAEEVRARLEQATDSEEAFQIASQGVKDIAEKTGATLTDTANLYARVSQAVKESNGTQADALTITQAVNEAMRLSGSSGQAGSAGVQQFVQALAAGALRGQDFHSVIEQVPALAQAIAAGLGVTSGKLKEMADQGELTTNVVLGALESQATKIDSAYQQTGATLTRALGELKTSVTETVGEIDQTTGASTGLAEAIDTIAKVISALGSNPAVSDAFSALGGVVKTTVSGIKVDIDLLALTIHGLELAFAEAAAGIALVLSKITFGDVSKGFADAADVLQTRADELKAKVSKNWDDLGTDTRSTFEGIGQTIVKTSDTVEDALSDTGDATDAASQKGQQLGNTYAQAAANAKAAANTFTQELSPAAQKLVQGFGVVATTGKESAAAIAQAQTAAKTAAPDFKTLFAGFDPKSAQNIRDVVGALDELRAQGKITAQEYQDGLQQLVKGLADRDLPGFAEAAGQAFGKSDAGVQQLADTMDALRTDALTRLGLDAQETFTGISAATRSSIAAVQALGQDTQTTAQEMQAALSASISKATTREDILGLVIAFSKVQVAGFDTVAAIEQLKAHLDTLPAEAVKFDPVTAALKALGVTSQQELDRAAAAAQSAFQIIQASGTQGVGVLAEAYSKMADAALTAAAAQGDTQLAITAGNLKVQASTQAEKDALDALIQKYPQLAAAAAAAGQVQQQTADDVTNVYNGLLQKINQAGDVDTLNDLKKQLTDTYAAGEIGADQYTAALEAAKQKEDQLAQAAQGIAAAIANVVSTAYSYYKSLSDEAAAQFNAYTQNIIHDGEPVEEYWNDLSKAVDSLNQRVKEQTSQANDLIATLSRQGGATLANVQYAEQLASTFNYVDSQTFSNLKNAISTVKTQIDSLNSSATQTLSDLQDQLDQLEGNTQAINDRQNAAQQQNIEAQLEAARAAGDQQAVNQLNQALAVLQQIAATEKQQAASQQASTNTSPATSAPILGKYAIEISAGGQETTLYANSQADAEALIKALAGAQGVSVTGGG